MEDNHHLGRRILFLLVLNAYAVSAQTISGRIVEARSGTGVPGVTVRIAGTAIEEHTDADGHFILDHELPLGDQVLIISKSTFLTKRFPISITEENKDLGSIVLEIDLPEFQLQTATISLADNELDEEDGGFSNISRLLQASKDIFLNAAAFDFSPAFFRPRGYDSEYSKVLINGIEMNKFFNGRPLWSNWGGLNDVQRNQVFSMGLSPSENTFGGLAGTINFIMRAADYNEGGKISYATSNRSYSGRIMASYSTGLSQAGWAFSMSVARRFASESFVDGTIYDANSFFAAVEKKINKNHSLNITTLYTPNRRGKSSPNTIEVNELKGNTYNSYWGYQDEEIRNSRIRRVEEPILMLNHYWKLSEATTINTGVAYQFGEIGDSRIDYSGSRIIYGENGQYTFVGGGNSPDPAYYQQLPSYFLRFSDRPDYTSAYLAEKEFKRDGQIDWQALYLANSNAALSGGNALYVLYEDRVDDQQITANSTMRSELSKNIVLNAGLELRSLESDNFARVLDLLGGNQYLDVDSFSEGEGAQNDLLHPNRLVQEGDDFKYHYHLKAEELGGFLQSQFFYPAIDFYAGVKFSYREYQRNGLFKNGNFPDNSLGESPVLSFSDYGFKAGATFKLTGKHLFDLNTTFYTKPPSLRNSFSNARQNNDVVRDLKSEKIAAADLGYIYRGRFVKGRITAFYAKFEDITEVSFYYADGLSGLGRNSTSAFVQEILSDIGKTHMGVEAGIEFQLLSTLKLKTALSMGEYFYNKNPKLYLTSDDFTETIAAGKAYIKNNRTPGGPQRVAQLGFEYRDPNFWWISATANYFSHAYLDVAFLPRTSNFYLDSDGLPIVNYDLEIAEELLQQERLPSYFLVNLVGGKSWRVKNKFIGIFASLNNILNTEYRTGGYEQSRNVNYLLLKNDKERVQPLFAPKYWFGPGTTYYAHLYIRF